MRKLKSLFQMVFSFGNATSVASKHIVMLLELFVYLLHYIVCLGEGWVECASTRELGGPPLRPHPKKFIKIGLRPIAWTAIFATFTLRIGVILEPLVLVEKAKQK